MNKCLFFILIVLFAACKIDPLIDLNDGHNHTHYNLNIPAGLPAMTIPAENPMTVEGVALGRKLFYDNIYQERYMGLPQENKEDFIKGSPISHAKNLEGNLLYIHGTGDDNVHYSNAEVLLNELIKYNKQFQFMAYPNRSHSISKGEGTNLHLKTLYTKSLKQYCPPGAR